MSRPNILRLSAIAAVTLSLGGCYEVPPSSYEGYTVPRAYAAPQAAYAAPPAAMPARSPGPVCRETHLAVMMGGETQDVIGTACRQPDGSWQLRN